MVGSRRSVDLGLSGERPFIGKGHREAEQCPTSRPLLLVSHYRRVPYVVGLARAKLESPRLLPNSNPMAYVLVAATWLPLTLFLLWMDLWNTRDTRRETSRHCLSMWGVFIVASVISAAL